MKNRDKLAIKTFLKFSLFALLIISCTGNDDKYIEESYEASCKELVDNHIEEPFVAYLAQN
jgi:hypothetical protein